MPLTIMLMMTMMMMMTMTMRMTTVTYWNDDPVATYGPRGQLQGSDVGRKPNKHSTILSLLMGGYSM